MNKILSQMEHALVDAKENFIDKQLMRGQKFRNLAHKIFLYLHPVEGELEDNTEFVSKNKTSSQMEHAPVEAKENFSDNN